MKIDLERFLALTAMLAAPLVSANGCIIAGSDDDDGTTNATNDTNGTTGADDAADDASDPSGNPSSADDAPGTDEGSTTDGGTGPGTTDDGTAGSTGVADSTGGNELGNCCEVHDEATCDVPEVSDCVCAEDPFCCESTWDMNCILEVNSFGCGECQLPPQVWDCSCLADCDGTPVGTIWQVCSDDPDNAAMMGTAACEMQLDAECTTFTCDECSCFSAEVPEIDCP